MSLSSHEENKLKNAMDCHIFEQPIGADRVRDHDHLTGKFRGAAHSQCNLQYKFRKGKKGISNFYIPVIAHNSRNYDLHHMMSAVGKLKDKKISCIPNNMEKYISCSLDSLRFIYSLQFLNATLNTVVSKLSKEGGSKFQNVSKHYPIQSERDLLRKGVYFDYMSSWNRFHDQELPPISKLANKLSDSEVSDVDGKHLACALWEIIMICI